MEGLHTSVTTNRLTAASMWSEWFRPPPPCLAAGLDIGRTIPCKKHLATVGLLEKLMSLLYAVLVAAG